MIPEKKYIKECCNAIMNILDEMVIAPGGKNLKQVRYRDGIRRNIGAINRKLEAV